MKKIAFVLILASFAGAICAQDFGVDVDSSGSFKSINALDKKLNKIVTSNSVAEFNKGSLWIKIPIGTFFQFDVKGNATWGGSSIIDTPLAAYSSGTFGWDVDLVKFAFNIPKPQADLAAMMVTFGRYPFADQTRLVWSGKADGASFAFSYGAAQFSVEGAYTGFLFKRTTTIALTSEDTAAILDQSVLFASPRAFFKAELGFPNIFNQSFAVSAFVQEDMRPDSLFLSEGSTVFVPGKGGHLDTQYYSARAAGPLFDSLYYDLFGTFGMGRTLRWLTDASSSTGSSYRYVPIFSELGSLALSWYPSFAPGTMLGLRGVFASGDAGKDPAWSGGFVPVSSTTLGLVFSPKLSNIALGEFTASAQPIPGMKLQTLLKALTFFRPTTGSISESGIKTGSSLYYLGSEVDLYITYRILSDLGISLTMGAFMPGVDPVGAFDSNYVKSGSINYSAGLTISISM